jgi:sulfur carrier protein
VSGCRVVLNGAPAALPPGTAVPELVRSLTGAADGVAIAVNGEVVPRVEWEATVLRDGDVVDVVRPMAGG